MHEIVSEPTTQYVIKPIQTLGWIFANDDTGTKLSGTGQEVHTRFAQQLALSSHGDKSAF